MPFLTTSAYKYKAIEIFESNFDQIILEIAKITLASYTFGNVSTPSKIIKWSDIKIISNNSIEITIDESTEENIDFKNHYINADKIIKKSNFETLKKYCRGHTFIIFSKKFFSAALFKSALISEAEDPTFDAKIFDNTNEKYICSSISNYWLDNIENHHSPIPLIEKNI